MKIQNMKAWLAAALLMVAGGADAQHAPRLLGGDLSMLPVYEEAEVVYRDYGGKPVELLPWLKSQGWNTVRVRLFVNPENASDQHKGEGVCQTLTMCSALLARSRLLDCNGCSISIIPIPGPTPASSLSPRHGRDWRLM